jgi:hypothetical protein
MRSRWKAASAIPRETLSSNRSEICPGRSLAGMTIVSRFLRLTLAPVVFVLLASCSDNGTDPPPPEPSGRQYPIAWPSLANSPWPMGNHDPQGTCRSPYVAASSGMISKYVEGLRVTGGPVLGEDGTIYYQSADSVLKCALYALHPDGALKWKVGIDSLRRTSNQQKLYSRLIVAADGTIYTNSLDEAIYAINPNGAIKWLQSGSAGFLDNGMTIGRDGTLYAGSKDRTLHAIRPDGSVKWTRSEGVSYFPKLSFSPDGSTLYVGGHPSGMYALALDATTKWYYPGIFSGQNAFRMVDNAGNIYTSIGDSLISIAPDGTRRWAVTMGRGGGTTGGTIDWNGDVYFANQIADSNYMWYLCSVDNAGKPRWRRELGMRYPVTMVSDAENTVYVQSGAGDGMLAVRTDMRVKWELTFSPHIDVSTSPAVASSGVMILPSGSTSPAEVFGLYLIQ